MDFISGGRLAVALLLMMAGSLAVWVMRAAVGPRGEAAAASVLGGWYLRTLAIALALAIVLCLSARAVVLRRALAMPRPIVFARLRAWRGPSAPAGPPLETMAARLVESGWTVVLDEEGAALAAVRRRFAPLGWMAAHACFAVALVAALLAGPPVVGRVVVQEGSSFSGPPSPVGGASSTRRGSMPAVSLSVSDVHPRFNSQKGVLDRLSVSYSSSEASRGPQRTLRPGGFALLSPSTLLSCDGVDLAPGYTFTSSKYRARTPRGFATLAVSARGDEGRIGLAAQEPRGRIDYYAYVKVLPAGPPGAAGADRTAAAGTPGVRVRAGRLLSDASERDYVTKNVGLGEPVDFAGNRLVFDALHYAAVFRVIHWPALPWVATCVLVGLSGLIAAVGWPRQECYVAAERAEDESGPVCLAFRQGFDRAGARASAARLAGEIGIDGEAL